MNEGWISLHRKIRDHWIFENPQYLRAWMVILMEVNHQDKKVLIGNEVIECKRGESLNSLETWARLFSNKHKRWSIQNVRTFLNLLKNEKNINTQGLQKTTRLTVLNYDTYQYQPTDKQQTTNRQLTTNNNDNNNAIAYSNGVEKIVSKYSDNKKDKSYFIDMLKKLQLPGKYAFDVVEKNSLEMIARQILLYEYHRNNNKQIKNPVGFLRTLLEYPDKYPLADGFYEYKKKRAETLLKGKDENLKILGAYL